MSSKRRATCVGIAAFCVAVVSGAAPASAQIGQGHVSHQALEAQFEQRASAPPSDVLAMSGVVLFGFAYTDSVAVALLSDRDSDKYLYIPAVGPWLDLTKRDCTATPCSLPWLSGALLVVDGTAQGAGVATMLASIFVPDRPLDVRIGAVRLSPARLGPGAYGFSAAGSF